MANHNKTIAFRLHDALAERLASQALERQMSAGEFARHLVIEHLGNGLQSKLDDALAATERRIAQLDQQLRMMTLTLLCNAGHAEADEAMDWVRVHMGPIQSFEASPPNGS